MMWAGIVLAWLSAACLYLASPHQSLWLAAGTQLRLRLRRVSATVAAIASVWLAAIDCGVACAFFIVLSAFMLALVALPYLDAWRKVRHVG
ncbi:MULTISPECIES: hypothetical protein [unclassified Janthinobacterium]|uniref:hypothetical protein n=1 Tax=unclassified Janthinobacterium TaxID=2610881 RepID=UPI00160E6F22|nr:MULTISPECIES: hypothetical protein [unclassified Janthinobacterium]MBB5369386.1 hypothetical protein [Janthinobacterium sp. K2C7]MBB5381078.1 hypothetical protein [Janthinobacterium sp. K2Li3]MBB5387769.1 hypothetical protein [Janthinobacterium sp. K2E3]